MTFVFARAPARAVAEALGAPVLLWRDGERLDTQLNESTMGLVAKMWDSDWAGVQL
jgi:hypothetical protein